jgi:hypothetical protein
VKTNHLQENSAKIEALFDPLPFETSDGEMTSRFGTIRKTPHGSLGRDTMKALCIMVRILEICSQGSVKPASRLAMLLSWDAFEPCEITAHLKASFGKTHPLEFLAKGGHLKDLKKVLNGQSLDFQPIASEIIKILNKVYPPHTGIRAENDREWSSIRSALYRICERLNERFARCRDKVPIQGADDARKAKRKR